jgi:methylisocitrate lyase
VYVTGAAQLRERLASDTLIEIPLAYDAMGARLAEWFGFGAVLIGGGGLSNFAFGLPDLGLVGIPEFCSAIAQIAAVTDLPLVADLDDCGGNPASVYRSVRVAEGAGAAGLMIEDLISAGKHPQGSAAPEGVRGLQEAVGAIAAAADARRDDQTVIIGRTDLLLTSPLSAAIERANKLVEAGADVAFLTHLKREDFSVASKEIGAPLLCSIYEAPTRADRQSVLLSGVRAVIYSEVIRGPVFKAMVASLAEVRSQSLDGREGNLPSVKDIVDAAEWSERFAHAT